MLFGKNWCHDLLPLTVYEKSDPFTRLLRDCTTITTSKISRKYEHKKATKCCLGFRTKDLMFILIIQGECLGDRVFAEVILSKETDESL